MGAVDDYDLVVVGAGIFGVYAATHFARRKIRVLLVESEKRLWSKASLVNQARVHLGYHYPRSIATARLANDYRQRFEAEHMDFINGRFEHFYGIDKHGSLTSAEQFERFCAHLGIPCQRVAIFQPLRVERLSAVYKTNEPSFDPLLLRRRYQSEVRGLDIELALASRVEDVEVARERWVLRVVSAEGYSREVRTATVLNATYSSINSVNALFGFDAIAASYEMSEIAIVDAPMLRGKGLTVMDGPYASIMPFGCSSFHSISSVLYTHHEVNKRPLPTFDCQKQRADCSPNNLKICGFCPAQPQSNYSKMISQLGHYLEGIDQCNHHGSLFTVKTKLQSTHIDDARPTDMRVLRTSPTYAYIFSGKINSIYEVESLNVQ